MADEPTATPDLETAGQPGTTPDGATVPAPDVSDGQAAPTADTQTSPDAPAQSSDPSFFDPTQVPEDLKPAYKQMQAAFTKKMQGLSTEKQKIEAYNAFMSNPVGEMQRLAGQYGYTLSRAEAQAMVNQGQQEPQAQQPAQGKNWEPQTWDEVLQAAEKRAEQRIMEKLQPLFQNVQQQTASNLERQFDELDPEWRVYEDDMRSNLQRHPTLVNDPAALYRMSVPEEVTKSRAMQAALKKLEQKSKSAKVGTKSTATKSAPQTKRAKTFDEAVELAKEQLAAQQ